MINYNKYSYGLEIPASTHNATFEIKSGTQDDGLYPELSIHHMKIQQLTWDKIRPVLLSQKNAAPTIQIVVYLIHIYLIRPGEFIT